MRHFFLVAVIALAGCTAQGLPIEGSGNPGGGGNGGVGGNGNGGANGGGSGPDLAPPLGNVGDGCMSACDCVPGLACLQGMCNKSMFGQLYCCDDSNNCPSGQLCQSSTGMYNQCGSGGSGGFGGGPGGPPFFGDMQSFPQDAGAGSMCGAIKCMTNGECIKAGCMTCSRRGTCR